MKQLFVVCGPTASGKTRISISLAKNFNTEIVSADSMQIYKYMDIGTAKPTRDERSAAEHHMIDCISPAVDYSVAQYQHDAKKILNQICENGKIPILAGGTGLYIQSIVEPVTFTEAKKETHIREELESELAKNGAVYLHDKLKEIDSTSAKAIHPNNSRRVIRALEVYYTTGKTMTEYKEENQQQKSDISAIKIGLTTDRAMLYERINRRVDIMVEEGLIDEVQKLLEMGYTRESNALQGIGYKEVISYFDGDVSLEEAIEQIKQGSRRYAKRQLTWFRRQEDIKWFDVKDIDLVEKEVLKYCEQQVRG